MSRFFEPEVEKTVINFKYQLGVYLTAFEKKTYIIDYINYTLFGTKIAGSI